MLTKNHPYPWQNPTHCHRATSLAVSLTTSVKKAKYVSSLSSVTTYGKKSVTNFWSLTWHKVSARLILGGEWYQTVNITHQHHSTRLNNKFVQTSNNYYDKPLNSHDLIINSPLYLLHISLKINFKKLLKVKKRSSTKKVWVFLLHVCWIMYEYCREKLHVNLPT